MLSIIAASAVTAMATNYFVSVRVGLFIGVYVAISKKIYAIKNQKKINNEPILSQQTT
jgi:hypothetical protein